MNDDQELLNEEIKRLKVEVEEYKNNWKRALADYQNLEKRRQQEHKELYDNLTIEIFRKIIPIVDSLEAAQLHLKDEGLSLVLKQFKELLEEEGIKRIETVNKNFDPRLMDCVEVVEGKEKDRVIEEVRAGYILGDKLLRAASVKVGGESNKNE